MFEFVICFTTNPQNISGTPSIGKGKLVPTGFSQAKENRRPKTPAEHAKLLTDRG